MERITDCTKMLTLEMQKGFERIRKLEKGKQNKPKAKQDGNNRDNSRNKCN